MSEIYVGNCNKSGYRSTEWIDQVESRVRLLTLNLISVCTIYSPAQLHDDAPGDGCQHGRAPDTDGYAVHHPAPDGRPCPPAACDGQPRQRASPGHHGPAQPAGGAGRYTLRHRRGLL